MSGSPGEVAAIDVLAGHQTARGKPFSGNKFLGEASFVKENENEKREVSTGKALKHSS